MGRTIWKFPLALDTDMQVAVTMPRHAMILTAQFQGDDLMVWAEVNPDLPTEERIFRVFGTGWEMPRGMAYEDRYIATAQRDGFVWHVYEQTGV